MADSVAAVGVAFDHAIRCLNCVQHFQLWARVPVYLSEDQSATLETVLQNTATLSGLGHHLFMRLRSAIGGPLPEHRLLTRAANRMSSGELKVAVDADGRTYQAPDEGTFHLHVRRACGQLWDRLQHEYDEFANGTIMTTQFPPDFPDMGFPEGARRAHPSPMLVSLQRFLHCEWEHRHLDTDYVFACLEAELFTAREIANAPQTFTSSGLMEMAGGIKPPTFRKYLERAGIRPSRRGEHGRRFTEDEAVRFLNAVCEKCEEDLIRESCERNLAELGR